MHLPPHPFPHPALVTQEAARRLPRWALLLLCGAYVLPGLFGRDPWRGADLNAFGQMVAMAQGRSSWFQPMLGGVPTDAALLPHWLGAAAVALWPTGWDAALAARLPFALLLALTLVAVWYSCFHLALREPAQPRPLAFGGEAHPVDYARAVADGAVLAMIATLGLLQLGHETTPELAQLAAAACSLWAMAAWPRRRWRAALGLCLALPALAASGAPAMALTLGLGFLACSARRTTAALGQQTPGQALAPLATPASPGALSLPPAALVAAALGLAALVAWPTHTWAWRLDMHWPDLPGLLRQWLWFLWPSGPLAIWTLWRWRGHWWQDHLALPLCLVGVALAANIGMGGHDRALMLGLPGLAVLAAFALPTLARSTSAAIDWFSVFFFSLCVAGVWLMYLAMQTGVPAKPAANILRLAPGFVPDNSWWPLLPALLGTLAWLALVRWRTGRHRSALWKSLVLPASGVAVVWLLLMTLWLPLLDYGRSNRPLAQQLKDWVPAGQCVAAPGGSQSLVAALEWHAGLRVDARAEAGQGPCQVQVLVVRRGQAPTAAQVAAQQAGWQLVATVRRPTERREQVLVLRRP